MSKAQKKVPAAIIWPARLARAGLKPGKKHSVEEIKRALQEYGRTVRAPDKPGPVCPDCRRPLATVIHFGRGESGSVPEKTTTHCPLCVIAMKLPFKMSPGKALRLPGKHEPGRAEDNVVTVSPEVARRCTFHGLRHYDREPFGLPPRTVFAVFVDPKSGSPEYAQPINIEDLS